MECNSQKGNHILSFPDHANISALLGKAQSTTFSSLDQELLLDLVEAGRRNAKSQCKHYLEVNSLLTAYLDGQQQRQIIIEQKEQVEQYLYRAAYTAIAEAEFNRKCSHCKEMIDMKVRSLIPMPYAVFGAAALLSTAIFGTLLGISIFTSYIPMNPWVNLMCFFGSLGLLATDVSAIIEYQKG